MELKKFESFEKEKIIYTALFVNDIEQLKEKYPPVHLNEYYHHSTIAYQPKGGSDDLDIGREHTLSIIGRVTSDKVDTLLVVNEKSTKEHPHITLSIAKGVTPVVSNEEIAKAIQEGTVIPLEDTITVTEGYFNTKHEVVIKKNE